MAKQKNKDKVTKKRVENTIVSDSAAKIVTDQHGDNHFVVIDQKKYLTFTNRRRGPMFFKREDGKEDYFKGKETKDDLTERESKMLMRTMDYANGWLVVETEDEQEALSIDNKNAFNDKALKSLVKKNKKNIIALENIVKDMTSEFAIERLKAIFTAENLPSSLVIFCGYRLKEVQESYLKTMEAPIVKEID